MKMIKEKLNRFLDLYQTYKTNQDLLDSGLYNNKGLGAAIKREQVFLKEKMKSILKNIQIEMQPKLFVVSIVNPRGEDKTLILRADSKEDIYTYVQLIKLTSKESLAISSITELSTIFKGTVTIKIDTK